MKYNLSKKYFGRTLFYLMAFTLIPLSIQRLVANSVRRNTRHMMGQGVNCRNCNLPLDVLDRMPRKIIRIKTFVG